MINMRNPAKLIKILLAEKNKGAVYVSEVPLGDLGLCIPFSVLGTHVCILEELHYG